MAGNKLASVTAAVLAGGLGTRLRSVIADRPKVLAPIAGRPFLAHLLDQLDRAGLREAVLLLGYMADRIRDEFGNRYSGIRLSYSVETESLGTAGAVRLALPLLQGKTILLMNGDSYCDLDLQAFANFHSAHEGSASLTLTQVKDTSRFGGVAVGSRERVLRFEEKNPLAGPGWINAGVYLFDRVLFEMVSPNTCVSLERDLLPTWISNPGVFGFQGGRFINIGVPESYAGAGEFFTTLRDKNEERRTNRIPG